MEGVAERLHITHHGHSHPDLPLERSGAPGWTAPRMAKIAEGRSGDVEEEAEVW